MNDFLGEDFFFRTSSEKVKSFIAENIDYTSSKSNKDIALKLYYAVRDKIRYNPLKIDLQVNVNHLDRLLSTNEGHCIDKAGLLITCLRILNIPARIGLSKVRNHMGTANLQKILGTNVLVPHGYAEVYLNGKWVKCTPAFNEELCVKLNVSPLDWDGESDSLFQQFDRRANQFMEYIEDYGTFATLPMNVIKELMQKEYPHMFENDGWKGIYA